jgi:glycosyltransferase involved in cell wall biosynthesis
LQAAEVLRQEGVDFELLLVENLRRDEARRLYERADLVVDQLLTGWYGGFAVEAMCLAKPVVCYIRDGDMAPLPQDLVAELPIIRATPATLGQVLRYWLAPARRERLRELGERSREFAERWHDPKKIAAQTAGDYERLYAERRFRRRPIPVTDAGRIRCGQ